jgi:hypothetical protein
MRLMTMNSPQRGNQLDRVADITKFGKLGANGTLSHRTGCPCVSSKTFLAEALLNTHFHQGLGKTSTLGGDIAGNLKSNL